MLFNVEVFEKFYPVGSYLQVRLSVTNNTGADFEYYANADVGFLIPKGGIGSQMNLPPLVRPEYPGISYTDYVDYRVFPAGETLVYEFTRYISPEYFVMQNYDLLFLISTKEPVTTPSGKITSSFSYVITTAYIDRNTQSIP